MYGSKDRLVVFDLDGTLVDAFHAVEAAFARHGMDIGDLQRFQRRRKLLKYLGGLREFPGNLRRHLDKQNRRQLKTTLTDIYRGEVRVFPELAQLLRRLIDAPDVRVGVVSRNVTLEPDETIRQLLARHAIDADALDFVHCLPLRDEKSAVFRALRQRLAINPARSYACGDEYRDYAAALAAAYYPFVVSYGFEEHARLVERFEIPEEFVARTPRELAERIAHALDLPA
jgi:phosphoglycolate phosphatase